MDKKELNQNLPILALIAACIFGFYFRLYPALQADFPLNDGGMFVQLTEELLESNFQLPVFTEYNFSQIPNAYPPLGFYLAALLTRLANLDILDIFRLLPAAISWLTIPAFYLAAKKMLKSALSISIAVVIFAIIPRSWLWMIMGGGLTRSLGMLFSILTIYFGYQLFTEKKQLLLTTLSFTLTVLSHPEALIFAALNLGLLFIFYNRTKTGFIYLTLVGFGALIASSPWWITVIIRHGIEPFLAAAQTGRFGFSFILHLLVFNLTGEPASAMFAALAVFGVFYSLFKKDYFLSISAIATLMIIPRSGPNYMIVPVAMLAALAINEMLIPALSGEKSSKAILRILLGYLLINLLISSIFALNDESTSFRVITQEEREAMQWIAQNTPIDSQFLVLSSSDYWMDPDREWFPYLAQRHSLNTLQGVEWLPDERFNHTLTQAMSTQMCLDQSTECLKQIQEEFEFPFSHIYLVRQTEANPFIETYAIEHKLRQDQDFELIYDGLGGLVFSYQP